MQTFTENSTVTLELEKDETLERHVLQAVINKAVIDPNTWAVYLIVAPEIANANKDMLLELGFLYSGNLSRGNTTFLRCKRHIRTSGEAGGNLAVAQPTLPPTAMEQAAVDEVRRRYSAPLSDERLAYLQSLGKQDVLDSGMF